MSSGSSSGCPAYCERSDVEAVYGVENVKKWADLDNDEDPVKIEARIEWARCTASDILETRLRGGPYDLPFEDPYPRALIDVVAKFSGILLHDSRGVEDFDQFGRPADALKVHRDEYESFVRDVHAGRRRLTLVEASKSVPSAVSL